MEAWTIRQLKEALDRDLAQCNNAFEKSMCLAIGGKEIREKAEQWSKERKLNPCEIAIAQQFGFRG